MDVLEPILIIDPDERRRTFARDVLDRAGYDVRAAVDEVEATGLVNGWEPVAVVTPTPPHTDGLSSCPVVLTTTAAMRPPEGGRIVAVVSPLDRADLLAAVWVTTNP